MWWTYLVVLSAPVGKTLHTWRKTPDVLDNLERNDTGVKKVPKVRAAPSELLDFFWLKNNKFNPKTVKDVEYSYFEES